VGRGTPLFGPLERANLITGENLECNGTENLLFILIILKEALK
jgi:hypothetical protein